LVEQEDIARIAEIEFSNGAIALITNPAAHEYAAECGNMHLRQTWIAQQ
jgi:hypothetical protein